MEARVSKPVAAFISYSHKDSKYKTQLESHLSLLKRQGAIEGWSDQEISSGADLDEAISAKLEAARIFLPLISSDFINSEYCYGNELKRAIERHNVGDLRVIPIMIRPVDWKGAPFAAMKMLPRDAKALTTWRNRDEAWKNVIEGIRSAIQELQLEQTDSERSLIAQSIDSEELGWLDLAANIEESLQGFLAQFDRLNALPIRIQESLKIPLIRLQAGSSGSASQKRESLSIVAKVFLGYASDTKSQLPKLQGTWTTYFNSMAQLAEFLVKHSWAVQSSENQTGITAAIASLAHFHQGIREPIEKLQASRIDIEQYVGISKDLTQAVKQNMQALDGSIDLMQSIENSLTSLLMSFTGLISNDK